MRRSTIIAAVVLSPMLALAPPITFLPDEWVRHGLLFLLINGLWGLLFYLIFQKPQVNIKACLLCFFFTGLVPMFVVGLLGGVYPWTILYAWCFGKNAVLRSIGMFFGVGINEELSKAAILFWLVKRSDKRLAPPLCRVLWNNRRVGIRHWGSVLSDDSAAYAWTHAIFPI